MYGLVCTLLDFLDEGGTRGRNEVAGGTEYSETFKKEFATHVFVSPDGVAE